MAQAQENPFRPGIGLTPPHRVGHEKAMRTLEDRLARISDGDDGDIVILHGPLGNGKTALLGELGRKAEQKKATVRVVGHSAMQAGDTEAARHGPAGPDTPKAKTAGVIGLEELSEPTIQQTLGVMLKKRPVLLAIDEAQAMPTDAGRNILQVAQLLIGRGMPLLLALAGTPDLRFQLRKTGAGFWERSPQLRIGRLESDDDARNALTIPAERHGLSFDDEALDLLVESSQRYPLFLQMLGAATWDVITARHEARTVTMGDARTGMTRADAEQRRFFSDRIREAEEQDVLAEALAVSKRLAGSGKEPVITNRELMDTLKIATADTEKSPMAVRHTLSRLGLVWNNDDLDWVPGIPSLCDHFVEQEKKR